MSVPVRWSRAWMLMEAARVPDWFRAEQCHGLWQVRRLREEDATDRPEPVGWPTYTLLTRTDVMTMHLRHGTVVMEDSQSELRQHLPVMIAARGRVLVTGLGLGCVVRGLLANPAVVHVDVVERDRWIAKTMWPTVSEFRDGLYADRASLYVEDAFDFIRETRSRWDFAWHDIHADPEDRKLALQHAELMALLKDRVRVQGAWGWDRRVRKKLRRSLPRQHALGIY